MATQSNGVTSNQDMDLGVPLTEPIRDMAKENLEAALSLIRQHCHCSDKVARLMVEEETNKLHFLLQRLDFQMKMNRASRKYLQYF